jgi:ACR3 family arsenite transporter
VLFVVIPLGAGWFSRVIITRKRGLDYFENIFIPKFSHVTIVGLLPTLIIIFSSKAKSF